MSDHSFQRLLENKLYDVEHALLIYAHSFATMPAQFIYDKKSLAPLMSVIKNCHIYLIGFQPKIDLVDMDLQSNKIYLKFSVLGKEYTIENPAPNGISINLKEMCFEINEEKVSPDLNAIQADLSRTSNAVTFDVKYIGQSFGREGNRNSIDRLLRHETLQKISLMGEPDGYQLTLLLLEIQPHNSLLSLLNPHAQQKDFNNFRLYSGTDKLFGTSKRERVCLYEAALIRYFSPQFNKEFKDSFPSTDLKILQDCYEKDFSGLVAEIGFDNLPFKLCSEIVDKQDHHIAQFDLHDRNERSIFFCVE